jgi:hypothetical protein
MKPGLAAVFLIIFQLYCLGQADTISKNNKNLSKWAYEVLNIPTINDKNSKEIIVAVIDDGFRLSHKSLKDFIYINKDEIPGNNLDDDQNGYIDDFSGWDISDMDNDVSISKKQETEYFHGTFIASNISGVAMECFGGFASKKIKILPVKVLSDRSESTAINDGYAGIKYAIDMQADIICCAWSGGSPSKEDKEIINLALSKGILIIASGGNFYKEGVDFPASITGVYAVAALDTLLRKVKNSNYGMKIDLALPGQNVRSAYNVADNAYFYGEGTSASAGLATGCVAVLKSLAPIAGSQQIIDALKNTATPIDSLNLQYCGKLGAGLPNLTEAIRYLQNPQERAGFFDPLRPEGTITILKRYPEYTWNIHPSGAYKSIHFIPENLNKKDRQIIISFSNKDNIIFENYITELRSGIEIPGSNVEMKFKGGKKSLPKHLRINYFVETIDSTKLYCSETIYIEKEEGQIDDNSGVANYSNNCNCKWQISAPENTRINLEFIEFDTEAKVDFVWLFDGTTTNPDNIIAKFSGDKIPPSVTSRTNKVLLWFVTDSHGTGTGWKLNYSAK